LILSAKKQLPSPLSDRERGRLEDMKPADRFGKSGYAMVPHAYFTVLLRKVSGLAQYHAIGYIIDRTFGAVGNPTWAKISGPQMARLSGMTAKAYTLVLDDAVSRGLIERKEDGRGFMYRAWPEAWTAIDDYELTAAADEPADEVEEEEAAAPAPPAPPSNSAEMTVANGKNGKPIVLSIAIKDMPNPVDLKLQTRNESGLPLVFRTAISDSGQVNLTVLSGETKAKTIGSPLPIAAVGFEKNQRFTAFAAFINGQCLKHFPKVPDPALMKRIVAAAGDASLDEFSKVVTARVAKLGRNHRYDATLLENLARDAARNATAARELQTASGAPDRGNEQFGGNAWNLKNLLDSGDLSADYIDLVRSDADFIGYLRSSHPDLLAAFTAAAAATPAE
jgi:hypothetical protein